MSQVGFSENDRQRGGGGCILYDDAAEFERFCCRGVFRGPFLAKMMSRMKKKELFGEPAVETDDR